MDYSTVALAVDQLHDSHWWHPSSLISSAFFYETPQLNAQYEYIALPYNKTATQLLHFEHSQHGINPLTTQATYQSFTCQSTSPTQSLAHSPTTSKPSHTRPASLRLFRMMMSFTALNTAPMLSVSVAHVTCVYTCLSLLRFFISNCSCRYSTPAS